MMINMMEIKKKGKKKEKGWEKISIKDNKIMTLKECNNNQQNQICSTSAYQDSKCTQT